ncbi:RNA polymerase II mediator complex subunit [Agyrium rufum]|nr:RNA polymerase II mediator complex subunit [Agyrium rufum]
MKPSLHPPNQNQDHSRNPLSISLRAWPPSDPSKDSLQYLIARITDQKGSFRDVTEEALEEDIRKGSTATAAAAADEKEEGEGGEPHDEAAEDEEDVSSEAGSVNASLSSSREEVYKARNEILGLVTQAHLQTAQALDFISLLLTSAPYTSKPAEASISPYIKTHLPLGTISSEILSQPPLPADEAKRADDDQVAMGWKMQALDGAADSLLGAAGRLGREVKRESKFWEQVGEVKRRGWTVCRVPGEKGTLGVRYGFPEAAPEYRDRGLAALRRTADGSVHLDLGLRAPLPQALRVRILEGGEVTARSSIDRSAAEASMEPLTRSILRARDAIFEEELCDELYREARSLANRGVRCTGDTIVIPLAGNREICLNLDSTEDNDDHKPEGEDSMGRESRSESIFAELLATVLRILLTQAHQANLKRRSARPPPITERKPPRQTFPMLRPVLNHLEHHDACLAMEKFIADTLSILEQAQVTATRERSSAIPVLAKRLEGLLKAKEKSVDSLVQIFCEPPYQAFKLILPSGSKHMTIQIRTHIHGPEFKISLESSSSTNKDEEKAEGEDQKPPSQTTGEQHSLNANETHEHIRHLLMLDIVEMLGENEESGWDVSLLHAGQLSINLAANVKAQMLLVAFDDIGLSLRWDGNANKEHPEGWHTWRAGTSLNDQSSRLGLVKLAQSVAKGFAGRSA